MGRIRLQLALAASLCFVITVLALLAGQLIGATTAAAGAPVYDEPATTRADTHADGAGGQAASQPSVALEGAFFPLADARGPSTTSPHSFIATKAGVPGTVRHFTTSEFADSISKGGEITPGPVSGRTWLTPDEYLDGATAQSRLALNKTPDGYFEIPMCRVGCPSSPSVVKPYNGQPGGGIEITTNSPIDVTGLPFIHFGAR